MKGFIFSCVLLLFLSCTPQALAVGAGTDNDCPSGSVCLDNPLNTDSPQKLIGVIIRGALGVVGSISLAIFVYGGFIWMLSGGNTEMVQRGKLTFFYATIGLIIIFSAYAITKFVMADLLGLG
ncbi:MAG: hypothetical protein QY316_13010 [Thermodesulfobacteriota bacterium]|nr:MAG: hypothetical protein QY316_13010 [Thermodesulfobacteriota bacterium]